jgi:hypothetical protein
VLVQVLNVLLLLLELLLDCLESTWCVSTVLGCLSGLCSGVACAE